MGHLLTETEVTALTALAEQDEGLNGRRAQALLSLHSGHTQAEAATHAGLTKGQLGYILRKFREERLAIFPTIAPPAAEATPETPPPAEPAAAEPAPAGSASSEPRAKAQPNQIQLLLGELDRLVGELRQTIPGSSQSTYSPQNMLRLVRANIERLAPDAQLTILKNLQSVNPKDLLNKDTWRGIAYMITYSAQFQAEQTREKLNAQLPEPLRPDSVMAFFRQNWEKLAPEMVQTVLSSLENTRKEDLLDPDTWKGLAYMLNYSAQYQAEQTREKLNAQLPEPFKPDTVLGFMRSALERVAPDVAKGILQTLENSSKEDLLDPDTWKGVWYMLNYSLQFQADQFKQRLMGERKE